ncbi:flagellar hook-basal body complex protein [Clostridium fallax]|uniref:Flagellar basal-body rod protein FlgG n=1 Tax=Clostridium fallax TaxID=1533 RepID=A0A1M4UIC7_9CLOT|nr:flagellar hook-basal body complex protein [Clostridium fallax]SHE56496.1 flagellar basal-body rod protein FlgG [Clostridium fallax]SQB07581.1 flagellar basal body rod protein FlgG [Clostridium fallax]
MLRMLWNGKNAMLANQEKIDAISNNLANVQTNGYKKVNVSFENLMTETLERKGYPTTGKEAFTGTGVRTTPWSRDDAQGILKETSINTNFALDGVGYFRVVKPDGTYSYTRDGAFYTDARGRLVDSRGNKLYIEYDNGFNENNVQFSRDNFMLDKSGEIALKENGHLRKVGKVPAFTTTGTDSLVSTGSNLFEPKPGAQMTVTNNVDMLQGFLEGSNVDMGKEFSDLIIAQRAFELGSRSVRTADEMWGMANNLRSR